MSYSSLILTSGISALSNRNIVGKILRLENSPVIFPSGKQNPELKNKNSEEDDAIIECLGFLTQHLSSHDTPEASIISAEYSLYNQLRKQNRIAKNAHITMVHTPSFAGRLAAELQRSFWDNHLHITYKELSTPFDPSVSGGLALASGAFIGTISRLLEGHQHQQTAFAPIGGYKVMVALGHIAASFHNLPSLYLHEDSQIIQEISPIPIKIDESTCEKVAPVARLIGNGIEKTALNEAQLLIVTDHPSFFTHIDDLVELNELGHFLNLDSTPILLSKSATQTLHNAKDKTSDYLSRIHQLRDLIIGGSQSENIKHQIRGYQAPTQWHLYKQGRSSLRIVWQLHPLGILIYHIWTDHQLYEKDLHSQRYLADPLPSDLEIEQTWIKHSTTIVDQ